MWFAYAICFVGLTTMLAMFFRKIALKTTNQRAFTFLFNIYSLVVTLAILVGTGLGSFTLSITVLGLVTIAGILHGLFHRYHFVARRHIQASVIETVMAPANIIGYTLAIVWLGESLTLTKVVGYTLIFIAGLVAVKKRGSRFTFNKFVVLAFSISACVSIASVIDRYLTLSFSSALTYAAILWLIQSIVCFVPYIPKKEILKESSVYGWQLPVLAAVNALVLYCLISALQLVPATKVMPVVGSNVVFIALAAIIFLNERDRIKPKLLAAVLACCGLFIITR